MMQAGRKVIYPEVFDNVIPDASFGITSKIFLDVMTPQGCFADSLENAQQRHLGVQYSLKAIPPAPMRPPATNSKRHVHG